MNTAIGILLFTVTSFFAYNALTQNEEDKVLDSLYQFSEFITNESPQPPVRAALMAKQMEKFISPRFKLEFEENEYSYQLKGKGNAIQRLALAKMRLRDFYVEIFDTEVIINELKADVTANVRGRGHVVNMMENFSEVRRFRFTLEKPKDIWILKGIQNIPEVYEEEE